MGKMDSKKERRNFANKSHILFGIAKISKHLQANLHISFAMVSIYCK